MAPKSSSQQQQPQDDADNSKQHESELEDSEDESEDDSQSTASAQSAASASSSKKKKKKNKKKKKGGGGQDGKEGEGQSVPQPQQQQQQQQQPGISKAERQALEKKFQAALSSLDDDLWVNLSKCLIQDVKVEKLFEKLKDNTSVTSVDLSANQISDAGAEAIGAMLEAQGAAPELISLDLRDNNLSPAGLERLAQLRRHRTQLDIKTGSASDPVLPPDEGKELKEVTKGPMFRKFFQSPGEEDDGSASQDVQHGLPDVSPAELWSRITRLVKEGQGSIPALAQSLQELCALLQHEFSLHTTHKEVERLLKLDSHAKASVHNLSMLQSILSLNPPDVIVQYSPQPQPAVGSHRVWAAGVLAILLSRGRHRTIDQATARLQLATSVLQLSLQRPLCNALQTKALHVLHACVNSTEEGLLAPMLAEADKPPSSGTSLLDVLVDLGSAAVEVDSGQRSSLMGFVIGATRILQGMCNDPPGSAIKNPAVKRAQQAHPRWSGFVKQKGPFEKFCSEQDAELGGPKPSAAAMSEFGDLGGGLMSSSDILALIEAMGT